MSNYRSILLIVLAGILFSSAGCGTMKNDRAWGEDIFLPPEGERMWKAACDAFWDPQTWIPLAGAAVFAIDDLDEQTSNWAVRHNPIYDSDDNARDYSDDLKDILEAEAIVTAILTPSGKEADRWGLAAFGATVGATDVLKDVTDRQRPDKSNDNSFPSGHASRAFSAATLSNKNLKYIEMNDTIRTGLQITNTVMASGVAWARVEGERHYPSDVLFGAALGHFLTAFIHDAFLNLPEDKVQLGVYPNNEGVITAVSFRF
ncbi:MAG: phosphatase PAP2 family protein [Planctomycetota bacterium]|jgi:membrane-associated phospholipid phosphatase